MDTVSNCPVNSYLCPEQLSDHTSSGLSAVDRRLTETHNWSKCKEYSGVFSHDWDIYVMLPPQDSRATVTERMERL